MRERTGRSDESGSGPTRVAVLADPHMNGWEADALEILEREVDVEIPLVVVNDEDDAIDSRAAEATANTAGIGLADLRLFLDLLRREGAWAFVLAERKLGWLLEGPGYVPQRKVPIAEAAALADSEVIRCRPETDGNWNELPPRVVDRMAEECDVAVRFGFGLLRGDVLDAPDRGVVSFHPGDIRTHRGLSPTEVFLDGDRRAGATLQVLNDGIDAGRIVLVEHVHVGDARTLDEVNRRLLETMRGMLARGIERMRDPEFTPRQPDELGEYTSIYRRRRPGYAGRVLAANLRGRGVRLLSDRLEPIRRRASRLLSRDVTP